MTTELTPEQRANMLRWILTLEGRGERKYEQTRHVLRRGDAFCCLGVACDLHNSKGWKDADADAGYDYVYNDEFVVLPGAVANWLGLDDIDPVVTGEIRKSCLLPGTSTYAKPGKSARQSISWWNDMQRYTFAEIAKLLRDEFNIHDEEEAK